MPKKTNKTKLPKIKKLPSGSFHCLVYSHTDESGKRIYESFTNADYNELVYQVAEFKRERTEEKDKRKVCSISGTLRDAFKNYIALKENIYSPSTVRGYSSASRSPLPIMDMQISKITGEDVQKAVNQLAKTRKPKTVHNYHGYISAVLGEYRPELKLSTMLPQLIDPDIVIPDEEEMKIIFKESYGTEMEMPIVLAACWGWRLSEITGLMWANVFLEKGSVDVKTTRLYDKDNKLVLANRTKTRKSKRTSKLYPVVLDAFKRQERKGEFVVTLTPSAIEKRFWRLLEKNNLPHYRFHDLRHYCVSAMLAEGAPQSYVSAYVGHNSGRMVERVYAHIMSRKMSEVEDKMQNYYENLMPKNDE